MKVKLVGFLFLLSVLTVSAWGDDHEPIDGGGAAAPPAEAGQVAAPPQAPPAPAAATQVPPAGSQVATDSYVPRQSGGTCWAHAGSTAASNATRGSVCYTPAQVADLAGKPYYGTGKDGVKDVTAEYKKIPGVCVFPNPGNPEKCFVPGTSGVMTIEGGGSSRHAVAFTVVGQGPNPTILIKDSAVGGAPRQITYSQFPEWQKQASKQFAWPQPARVETTTVFKPAPPPRK